MLSFVSLSSGAYGSGAAGEPPVAYLRAFAGRLRRMRRRHGQCGCRVSESGNRARFFFGLSLGIAQRLFWQQTPSRAIASELGGMFQNGALCPPRGLWADTVSVSSLSHVLFTRSVMRCVIFLCGKKVAFISWSMFIHTVGLRAYVSADVEGSVSTHDSSNLDIVVWLLTLALRSYCRVI